MDTTIRHLSGCQNIEPRRQQPGTQKPPVVSEFSGRSVYAGVGSSSPPPTHSLIDPVGPDDSRNPPVCTSIANNPGTGLVSGDDLPATFEHCLLSLDQAYDTDFSKLAVTLSYFVPMPPSKDPCWKIFHEFIDMSSLESNSCQKLRELGKKIRQLYLDEYHVLAADNSYPRISELTIVLCMHFLEQKFILEPPEPIQQSFVEITRSDNASTDCQHLLPAWVRKTFFEKLLSGIEKSRRADAGKKINKFIDKNQSGLRKDMVLQQPATGHLKFSGLRYDDIPGATIAKRYHCTLSDYSRDFSIDLRGLIEALGQSRSQSRLAVIQDPLEQAMKIVSFNTSQSELQPANFFNNKLEPFRDRNARTLLKLIEYFRNRVAREYCNGHGSKTMKDSLSTFLKDCCGNNTVVKRNLNKFFEKT
ncbi:hypothetical protein [Endozoicomonas acroporae]|uniref:hypothetical protein n=1 Tax=Endozoicomonas acroporae TaxID=1701104 RepID=UPI003D7A6506